MDELNEDLPRDATIANYIYWCPHCGTILQWDDSEIVRDSHWTMINLPLTDK